MGYSPEEFAAISYFDSHVEEVIDPYKGLSPLNQELLASYEDYWAQEVISFVEAVDGTDVLALGCGTARDAVLFKEEGANYIGIDISSKILQGAATWIPRPTVARMNMRRLGFADDSFDGTWSFDSFSYIPKRNVPEVLDEMRRVTRPTGLAYISACPEGMLPKPQALINYWKKDELEELVTDTGFSILSTRYDPMGTADPYITMMLSPNKTEG
jgi:ubiquinone/menaquinone biosynthesis C-methylase UbiE